MPKFAFVTTVDRETIQAESIFIDSAAEELEAMDLSAEALELIRSIRLHAQTIETLVRDE
jgi:hypothetical protein